MLKIYFTASMTSGGGLEENYRHIIACLEKSGIMLISGQQIIDQRLSAQEAQLSSGQIFKRERKRIDEADVVISEVTIPSTGVGGEIVYALTQKKPVLALVFKENEDKISPMVEGNPSENLFLEHYNFDNLHIILKHFITHMRRVRNRKGKLIVIDGADGSGKTTQATLLVDFLKEKKIPVKYFDFPRYYTSFHGKTIAQFLRGEFGQLNTISPYLISLAYALDRASVKEEMDEFLEKGGVIVCNRYATSTMAHQTARLKNEKEKSIFLKWIYELEYKIHKIPKEDIVIYLTVPWKIGTRLISKKEKRNYLQGNVVDIAERDERHRIESEKMYQWLARKYNHWITIECVAHEKMLSPQKIHTKIVNRVKNMFLICDEI
ncbi:MAG TPA: nucleoside 2-deoxyribosyltransferase [Patescibacteria group bacterium]|nr:nucleoside 2-deoxyribosyltransferase [Patescibacteria group bacterium]